MRLYFLGTSAAVPSVDRNLSALALRFEQRPDWYLFDCGEGTQRQLLRSPFSLARLTRIFISHLHGDHWFGLPGVITSRSLLNATTPLEIFGPPGLKEILERILNTVDAHLGYDLQVTEITGENQELVTGSETISTIELSHSTVRSFGFLIQEHDRPGVFDAQMARDLGIPEGPIYGRLKAGEVVPLDDGRVIDGRQFLGPAQKGRKLLICGDNDRPRVLLKWLPGVQLLVHEATYTDRVLAKMPGGPRHTTARQIAQAAESTQVPNLVLTHFSARFGNSEDAASSIEEVQQEAASAYTGRLFMAEDHAEFQLAREGAASRC